MLPQCAQTCRKRLSSGGIASDTACPQSEQKFIGVREKSGADMGVQEVGAEFNTDACRQMRIACCSKLSYSFPLQTRGGAVWQLVGLITRRSQVQILSPQPDPKGLSCKRRAFFVNGPVLSGNDNPSELPYNPRQRRFGRSAPFRCQINQPPVLPAHHTPAALKKFHKPATGSPASPQNLFVLPAASLMQALICSCSPQPTSITRIVDEYI